MVVNSYDGTFASRTFSTGGAWCDAFPIYGRAFACPSPRGNAKIDLRDTGFYIPESVRISQTYNDHEGIETNKCGCVCYKILDGFVQKENFDFSCNMAPIFEMEMFHVRVRLEFKPNERVFVK